MTSGSSPSPVSTAAPSRPGRRKSPVETLMSVRELAPALGLVGVAIFFTLQTTNFWSPQTMTAISTVASTIGIVSIGVTISAANSTFLSDRTSRSRPSYGRSSSSPTT
jgi:hypothetical protein